MGWFWFIPTFHMPQPPPTASGNVSTTPTPTHWLLSRKDVDFPIGIGNWIVDIDLEMSWLPAGEGIPLKPGSNSGKPVSSLEGATTVPMEH